MARKGRTLTSEDIEQINSEFGEKLNFITFCKFMNFEEKEL